MIEFNEEFGAYAVEFDDVIVCWDDEPDDSSRKTADDVRNAYHRNIKHIAETIYDEIKEMFDVKDADEVISKLGKPMIYPDNGQVTYCDSHFDQIHTISFEYLDDAFDEIEYVSVDG